MTSIPGYRLGDPTLAPSPVTPSAFEELKTSLLFGPDDVAALRRAHDIVAPQVEAILDVWYGFVGANPHLLRYFTDPATGQPVGAYLDRVRKRFGQWILVPPARSTIARGSPIKMKSASATIAWERTRPTA